MRATQTLLRRTRHFQLTTKGGPRGYYKGTRTGSMGSHTKHGGYIVDYSKVRTYVTPMGLDSCKLTPFVTNRVKPMRGDYGARDNLPSTGTHYLRQWKAKNGAT